MVPPPPFSSSKILCILLVCAVGSSTATAMITTATFLPAQRGRADGKGAGRQMLFARPSSRRPPPPAALQQQLPAAAAAGATTSTLLMVRGGGDTGTSCTPVKSLSTTALLTTRGGQQEEPTNTCPFTRSMAILGSVWGSFGVVYVLAKAVRRVLPIAMEPFGAAAGAAAAAAAVPPHLVLTPVQWSMYALSCAFFAYAEGYKGFHLKFAPLVVKRSFSLLIGTPQGDNPLHFVFAPLYSMGLFHSTRRRLATSWGVTLGVAGVVAAVKRLPPAPRCILDAGVVVGLCLGSLSILYHYVRSVVTGVPPAVDACLPER